jgi:5-formyltetrahydrofolate cyclo-ligase
MTKKEARKLFREKREKLTIPELEKLQDLVLINFQHLQLPFLYYVHSYLPIDGKKEVNPYYLTESLEFKNPGLQQVLPKVDPVQNRLRHYILEETTILRKNQYDILEPEGGEEVPADLIDLVFVPLLAFDERGHRAGYGKGYYDRFLAECRPDTIKIGLSFFDALERIEDTGNFDIRLDYCITPLRMYEF